MADFERAIPIILKHEGEYLNNPLYLYYEDIRYRWIKESKL